MKGILLCEHLADLDVHKWSRRSQAGGDGEAGLPNRGRKPKRALREGKLGRERGADLEKLTLGLWGPAGRGRWEVLCLKSI